MSNPFTAAFDADDMARQVDAGDVFLNQRMRGRLAHEQEVASLGEHGLAHRLVGKQIVAEVDRVEPGIVGTVGGQPATCRTALTILFLRAILRGDELWLERHDMIVPRCNQGGTQHGMVVLGLAIAAPPLRALLAVDFF